MNNVISSNLAVLSVEELSRAWLPSLPCMQIELILDVEANLPDKIRRKFIVLQCKEKENKEALQEVKVCAMICCTLGLVQHARLVRTLH